MPEHARDRLHTPRPSSISVHSDERLVVLVGDPFWMAAPIAKGISAWDSIQSTPKKMPPIERRHLLPAHPEQEADG